MAQKNLYDIHHERACGENTREDYWREHTNFVEWYKEPTVILDKTNPNPGFWRWFADGQINICHNCIDRHLDRGDEPALHWFSAMAKRSQTYSWKQLYDHVARLAFVYQRLGVKTGDRVIIYCPQIPEGIMAMLASARVGAIHSVVFGGFAAKELASRIVDAKPTLLVTASCGLEPNKLIPYKEIVDEALSLAQAAASCKVLLVQREMYTAKNMITGRDFDFYQEMSTAQHAPCVPVLGSHPLYILYTSGTTGQPKGIVRDQGGTAVAASWTMHYIMNIKKGDVYFSTSDIGWVVGHTFIVYGPLLRGATTVLYEGKPTGTPNPGVIWSIIEKYKVNGLYTAPTALRALRREDIDGKWIKKYNTSSLKGVSMAGERCDVPTYEWIQNCLGVIINDNYWQTETGWIISCNYFNLHTFKTKPGSAIKPAPGYLVHVLDQDNKIITEPNKLGRICVKLPMPPSFMMTLYNNDDAYVKKYLSDSPGYYLTGDSGYFDDMGYLNVMARIDDIINTAGHRLSTAQMEEVLLKHEDVVEAAVVSKIDEMKGEIPIGFVVLKEGRNPDKKKLEQECVAIVRKEIGPVASFQHCLVVEKLPKTRSGKILRAQIKIMVDGGKITKIPPTIDDPNTLTKIEEVIKNSAVVGKVTVLEFGDKIKPSL